METLDTTGGKVAKEAHARNETECACNSLVTTAMISSLVYILKSSSLQRSECIIVE